MKIINEQLLDETQAKALQSPRLPAFKSGERRDLLVATWEGSGILV